jgi:hypothetical protein
VTEEVPLSEFVTKAEPDENEVSPSEQSEQQDDAAVDTAEHARQSDRPVDPTEVTPAQPTSSYEPAGGTCDGCGQTVERRFNTDTGFRCVECVSWRVDQ